MANLSQGFPAPANTETTLDTQRLRERCGPAGDAGLIGLDDQGRVCVASTPPLRRASMVPEPWITNPVVGYWQRWRGRRHRRRIAEPGDSGAGWRAAGSRRRSLLLLLVVAQTIVATWYMRGVLPYQGRDLLEIAILVLFALLFGWVSSGFWTALAGFLQLVRGRDRYSISANSTGQEPIDPAARTAIVMPICNESVERVFAGLRATYESLARTGHLEHFDVFVLSDTYDPDIAVAEQNAWVDVCRATGGFGRIFYRRRRRRVKRKSGNIDDFCRRWGADYHHMVVLDADSVMTGDCLVRMVQLMQANPRAGIIQTAPRATGMDSLYARAQQFATRVYGPLFTAGLHYWQLGESHYWGHNAIIRLEPFMEHCALAPLPGKGAFAGAILSHDFVEAALMRRAGWGVWIAYDLPGSYEELPPNLLEELQRDQRWCHGNLMNFRLFLTEGLHPVHRAVFLTGVMSYLSAPLWFLFLLLSTALLAVHTLTEPQYFVQPHQLFPLWPQWQPLKAVALLSATALLLFLPKVLSVLLIALQDARGYGGRLRLAASMVLESLLSMLLAPVRMLFHTRFIVATFAGGHAKWVSPSRDNDATAWSDAFRAHASQSLLGLGWLALVYWLSPSFLWWMLPILVAWLVAIPISVWSSRVSWGQALRRARLFCIPEEVRPPAALRATRSYHEQARRQPLPGFDAALSDPDVGVLARALARARHRGSAILDAARLRRVREWGPKAPDGLTAAERMAVLDDPVLLTALQGSPEKEP
ncbi:MAG: glucans biosynthesis glucosyltransferase MdoH [Pigmentiphaga sp.]